MQREGPTKGGPPMAMVATGACPGVPAASAGFQTLQAVRSIFDSKKYSVRFAGCLDGVDDAGRNIENRATPCLNLVTGDDRRERSLHHVYPLLVGMRVRVCARAGGHSHQGDDHAIALHTRTCRCGVFRTAVDVGDLLKVQPVFVGASSVGSLG